MKSSKPSILSAANLPTLEAIEKELQRRDAALARTGMEHFIAYMNDQYLFGWFNQLICRKLDKFLKDVAEKRSPRLMLFAPPRHGKSEIVSRQFPAYALGHYPDMSIISTSYSTDLVMRMNRDVQRIITDPRYHVAFPGTTLFGSNVRTVADGSWLRNSDIFEVVGRKGSYRAAGVGGGITGMGGHILSIDDPIKDAEQAGSTVYRDKVWDWYTSTLFTRKMPGAGILLIMTRWNQDDLAGRLLKAQETGGDVWDVVSFPAIAEHDEEFRYEGEALHPERYSRTELDAIKGVTGSYVWAALYQQRPAPRDGGMFRRSWFEVVDAPSNARRDHCRGWDFAASIQAGSSDPDWTVGCKMSRDRDGVFYIEQVERFRGSALHVEQAVIKTASQDGEGCYIRIPQDPGQAGKGQAEHLTRALAGYVVKVERETGSKEVRAAAFAAQCEAGNVKLIRGKWNEEFLGELENFPNGLHDDQVDAAAGAFNELTLGAAVYDGSLDWVGEMTAPRRARR